VSTSGGVTPVRTHAVWDCRYYATSRKPISCQPSRAPHRRYIIIAKFSNEFYLIFIMCASVRADFLQALGTRVCPRPGLAPAQYGTVEQSSTILSVEK